MDRSKVIRLVLLAATIVLLLTDNTNIAVITGVTAAIID